MSTALRVLRAGLPYFGPVGNRTFSHNFYFAGGAFTFCSQTWHVARETIAGKIRIKYPGFHADAVSGEISNGGNNTVKVSVFDADPTTAVNIGVSGTITIPNGGLAVCDINLSRPIKTGSYFWLRPFVTTDTGTSYCQWTGAVPAGPMLTGSALDATDTAHGDLTPGNSTITDIGGNLFFPPIAISGLTRKPTFGLVGDSRIFGIGDQTDATGDVGDLGRSIGAQGFGYTNTGVGGNPSSLFKTNNAGRLLALADSSHIIAEIGAYDFVFGGDSVATATADTLAVLALFPGRPVYQTTSEPVSSSTNSWIDTANQTTDTSNANRISWNTNIRGGAPGYTGYFDLAQAVENSVNGGLWVAPGGVAQTVDGAHPNLAGYNLIGSSGVVSLKGIPFNLAAASYLPRI